MAIHGHSVSKIVREFKEFDSYEGDHADGLLTLRRGGGWPLTGDAGAHIIIKQVEM